MCLCTDALCHAKPVQSYAQGHTGFLGITLIGVLWPCAPALLPDRRLVFLVVASASATRKPHSGYGRYVHSSPASWPLMHAIIQYQEGLALHDNATQAKLTNYTWDCSIFHCNQDAKANQVPTMQMLEAHPELFSLPFTSLEATPCCGPASEAAPVAALSLGILATPACSIVFSACILV